jgi:hypothetical protein
MEIYFYFLARLKLQAVLEDSINPFKITFFLTPDLTYSLSNFFVHQKFTYKLKILIMLDYI